MSAPTWLWTEDRKSEVEAVIRGSRTRNEAAARLGVTVNSLAHAAEKYGFTFRALLQRGPAPLVHAPAPPAGVSVPEEPVTQPPPRAVGPEGVERRVFMCDLHMPEHSVRDVACALEIVRLLQPHVVIVGGDLLNLNSLSRHPDYAVARETFDRGTMAARAFLRTLRAAFGGKLYVLEGNHCKWARDYEVTNPRVAGSTFSIPIALGLRPRPDPKDPGVTIDATWVPEEDQPLILGPVAYLHGTLGGEHFAKRYADTIGPRHRVLHVVNAHHHAAQAYSHKNGITAQGVGHLANDKSEAFDYAKPPRGWRRNLLVEDVAGELITDTVVPIVNGRALFGGRLISTGAA